MNKQRYAVEQFININDAHVKNIEVSPFFLAAEDLGHTTSSKVFRGIIIIILQLLFLLSREQTTTSQKSWSTNQKDRLTLPLNFNANTINISD